MINLVIIIVVVLATTLLTFFGKFGLDFLFKRKPLKVRLMKGYNEGVLKGGVVYHAFHKEGDMHIIKTVDGQELGLRNITRGYWEIVDED